MIEENHIQPEFESSDWPLHITLVGNFLLDKTEGELIVRLGNTAVNIESIDVRIGDDTLFGPSEDIPVSLVEESTEIMNLQRQLVDSLSALDPKYYTPEIVLDRYRPHVTIQKSARLNKGQSVNVNNMTLVGLSLNGDPNKRRVIKTFNFNKG